MAEHASLREAGGAGRVLDVHQVIEGNARSFKPVALALAETVPGKKIVRRSANDDYAAG